MSIEAVSESRAPGTNGASGQLPNALPLYFCSPRPEVAALIEPAGKRILEIGCGAGNMGASLLERGAAEVVGVELHHGAVAAARTRLSAVIRSDLNQLSPLPYPDGYFDCITFSDVLEHVSDPAAVLAHLLRYLAAGGAVVASLPNVRHESVALSLLVDGAWDYGEAGILDRSHLRFFTLKSMLKLFGDAGLDLAAPPQAVHSTASPYLDRAAGLVAQLGGDVARFREESTAIQYLLSLKPRLSAQRLPRAAMLDNPWAGSRRLRVLFTPDFDNPADDHEAALTTIIAAMGSSPDVTIGVALPRSEIGAIPPSLARVAEVGDGDLLLLERPVDAAGWQRLFAATSLYVATSENPELERLAGNIGLEVTDGRKVSAR